MYSLNEQIFFFVHMVARQSPWLDAVVVFFADSLDMWVVIFAGLVILLVPNRFIINNTLERLLVGTIDLVKSTVALGLTYGVVVAMKALITAPRPFVALPYIQPLFEYGAYDSFPSGHATLFAAIAYLVYRHHRGAGMVCAVAAVLIGTSRTIVGIHFPIDILAGWLLGVASIYAWVYIFAKIFKRV